MLVGFKEKHKGAPGKPKLRGGNFQAFGSETDESRTGKRGGLNMQSLNWILFTFKLNSQIITQNLVVKSPQNTSKFSPVLGHK